MSTVLVVDDEKLIRETLKDALEDEGYNVLLAENGKKALQFLELSEVDVVLLDLWLPEVGGMEVLNKVKEKYYDVQVIIISGHGTIETAVEATKRRGALDFIVKPFATDTVLRIVKNAIKITDLERENLELRERSQKIYTMVKGASKAFREVESLIESCAKTNSRVLITGENGTGKEVVARKIHEISNRRDAPFIPVNCAAIPKTLIESELFGYERGAFTGAIGSKKGRFELADRGTIFLDEIADMSLEAQSKVLRILEEMQFERVGGVTPIKINVRVIAATNKNIMKEIEDGMFREDLFYRLNVVPIYIKPLRERREDIPILIGYYLEFFEKENNKKKKPISREALQFLTNEYPWPGNIRELKNLIERLTILSKDDTITINDVMKNIPYNSDQPVFVEPLSLKEAKEFFEKKFIDQKLTEFDFNITKAAQALKIERSNLHKLIKKHGIEVKR